MAEVPGEVSMNRRVFALLLSFLAIVFAVAAIPVRAEEYSHIRIVRLSFVEGEVQYQRAGEDWQPAGLNLPIEQGFSLQTGAGYAEVEFENGLVMRLARNSLVQFPELALADGARITRLNLSRGTATVSANISHHDVLSVAASNLKLTVPHSGRFRVDANASGAWVTVLHGDIDVESGAGSTPLAKGHTLHEDFANAGEPEIAKSPSPDAFDKWVNQREQALEISSASATDYLSPHGYTTGFADLYDSGLWYNLPGYGLAWQPYGVGAGWMPFMDGQWGFMGDMGWTWMSNEPWGWLPYHFGGWVESPGQGWLWVPGNGQMWQGWQPGTASWVTVGGQNGWIPTTAVPSKPTKSSSASLPRSNEVILATVGSGNTIRPGVRVPLTAASALVGSAPPPVIQWSDTPIRAAASANAGADSQARGVNAPARLQAPRFAGPADRAAVISGRPVAQAPHSAPVPATALGARPGGFGGGSYRGVSGPPSISGAGAVGPAISASQGAAPARSMGSAPAASAPAAHHQ
jgi:hypothetical protein